MPNWIIIGLGLLAMLGNKTRDLVSASGLAIRNIINNLPINPRKAPYGRRSLSQINKIILHHSDTADGNPLAYANYHINENDWPGIGYHFVIQKDGTVFQTQPLDVISYHTAGQNTSSIGIALTGDYDWQTPPSAQIASLVDLLRDLKNRFGSLPLYGHNQFSQKTCPGSRIDLARIRQELEMN